MRTSRRVFSSFILTSLARGEVSKIDSLQMDRWFRLWTSFLSLGHWRSFPWVTVRTPRARQDTRYEDKTLDTIYLMSLSLNFNPFVSILSLSRFNQILLLLLLLRKRRDFLGLHSNGIKRTLRFLSFLDLTDKLHFIPFPPVEPMKNLLRSLRLRRSSGSIAVVPTVKRPLIRCCVKQHKIRTPRQAQKM